jgi:aspartate carbamoyltransferase catalytic subunit
MKALLGLRGVTGQEILELAGRARDIDSSDVMAGNTVGLVFLEPSTRTRLSFDQAASRLGARTMTFDPEWSSMAKGESVVDTFSTLVAIGADILVIRSREEGLPAAIHAVTGVPVINAGDGTNEHPTQALGDVVTLLGQFGSVSGIRVALVGDIAHSRVANSLIHALSALGATLTLVGPTVLTDVGDGLSTTDDFDSVLAEMDVVYMLRVQRERGVEMPDDYIARYQLGQTRAKRLREGAVVMHPGPVNRGVELTDEVADGPRSLILDQVRNGVRARMAVLEAMARGIT